MTVHTQIQQPMNTHEDLIHELYSHSVHPSPYRHEYYDEYRPDETRNRSVIAVFVSVSESCLHYNTTVNLNYLPENRQYCSKRLQKYKAQSTKTTMTCFLCGILMRELGQHWFNTPTYRSVGSRHSPLLCLERLYVSIRSDGLLALIA